MNYIFLHIFFILIILMSLFTQNCSHNIREPFIPKIIKEHYRPITRNMRINYETFCDKSSLELFNLFRKFKII
jgi:hypothetical protein